MFERFTRDARAAVRTAAAAASDLGHPRVDTVHLLLGISAQGGPVGAVLVSLGVDEPSLRSELARARAASASGDGLDADALSMIGIDYDAVRQAAEERFGPGALSMAASRRAPRVRRRWPKRGHVPFAGESKRALTRSLVVAQRRAERELRSSHILLSILEDPFCTAVRLFEERGLTADEVRAALGTQPG